MRRTLRKALSLLLTAAMVISLSSALIISVKAATNTWNGIDADVSWYVSNPDATSFTLSDANDLAGFAAITNSDFIFKYDSATGLISSEGDSYKEAEDFSGDTIKLGADIDLNHMDWAPIGSRNVFKGTFDGCGHMIFNLTVGSSSSRSAEYAGLFGRAGYGAVIKNLTLDSASVYAMSNYNYGKNMAGCLIGSLGGDNKVGGAIINCHITGTSVADANVSGGLAGAAYNKSSILNCSSSAASVSGTIGGGLIGFLYIDGLVANSFATGNVTAGEIIGGLIGESITNTFVSTLQSVVINCYSTGTVGTETAGGASASGGFMGWGEHTIITSCYSAGFAYVNGSLSCLNGFAGYANYTTYTCCYWTSDNTVDNSHQYSCTGEAVKTTAAILNTAATVNAMNAAVNTNDVVTLLPRGVNIGCWVVTAATYPELTVMTAPSVEVLPGTVLYSMKLNTTSTNLYCLSSASFITQPKAGDNISAVTGAVAYTAGSDIKNIYDLSTGVMNYVAVYKTDATGNIMQYMLIIPTMRDILCFEEAGTKSDPYRISNKDDMVCLAGNVNCGAEYEGNYFLVTANIALSGSWTPIAGNQGWFCGTFNGGGYTISGLTVGSETNREYKYAGLFGFVGPNALIENVVISGAQIYGKKDSGGCAGCLAGFLYGDSSEKGCTVKNCSVSGSVDGYYAGGLSGQANYATMINCSADAAVTGTYGGGLIANSEYDVIANCSAKGSVSGGDNAWVGGLIGYSSYDTVVNSYAAGTVNAGAYSYIGGLVGCFWYGKVANCYASGAVTASSTPTEASKTIIGGFIGTCDESALISCYFDSDKNILYDGVDKDGKYTECTGAAVGNTTEYMQGAGFAATLNTNAQSEAVLKAAPRGINVSPWVAVSGGYPKFGSSYLETPDAAVLPGSALYTMKIVCSVSGTDKLAISISDTLPAIPTYNQAITLGSGISLYTSGTDINNVFNTSYAHKYVALYQLSASNTVEKYMLIFPQYNDIKGYTGTGTKGNPYVISGALGMLCFAANVNSGEYYEDTFFELSNDIDLDGIDWMPIGFNNDSYFCGTFNGKGYEIKNLTIGASETDCRDDLSYYGLFGNLAGNISNLGVTDAALYIGDSCTGLLVGSSYGTINNCYTTGSIFCTADDTYNTSYIGGLVGYDYGHAINCFSRVSVTSGSYSVIGGFAGNYNGYYGNILNCYCTGSVSAITGSMYVTAGGFAGSLGSGNIANCYSAGAVTGAADEDSYTGGFAGFGEGTTLTNCYYNSTLAAAGSGIGSQQDVTGSALGLSTDVMKGNAVATINYTGASGAATTGSSTEAFILALNGGRGSLISLLPDDIDSYTWKKDSAAAPENGGYPVFDVSYAVAGVTLDKTTLTLIAGGTDTLTATVLPSKASNKNVTWSSDKENIATVSNGVVRAIAPGTATITVTTVDGNKSATCAVTVTESAKPCTVWFNSNGGSSVPAITQYRNTTIAKPADPTREGYTFAGWYSDFELKNAVTWPYTMTENVIFFAKWCINRYTVVFNSNGGNNVAPITEDYNTEVTLSVIPVKTGYKFVGWNTKADGTGTTYTTGSTIRLTEDILLYAVWIKDDSAAASTTSKTTSPTVPVITSSTAANGENPGGQTPEMGYNGVGVLFVIAAASAIAAAALFIFKKRNNEA